MNHYALLNVLVVEDHSFQRNYLMRLLEQLKLGRLEAAENGKHALELIERQTPDLIFLDLKMPGMDGVQMISHLAQRGFPGSIVLTSGLDPDLLETVERLSRTRGIAVLGRLEKPLQPDQVRHLLDRHGQQRPRPAPARMLEEVTDTPFLRDALAAREFVPWFQPKVDFATGRLAGVEALARWQNPELGIVGPATFLPTLEREGMVSTLTEIISQAAVKQCRDWLDADRRISISLNLSQSCLSGKHVYDWLVDLTASYAVPPELIVLEVTESAIASDLGQAIANLVRFRMHGFSLSIDDFGTGYSSLQQLNRIPFTELKIDREFIHGVNESRRQQAIVESSLQLAKGLRLKTTVEGVEHLAEWLYLKQAGCNFCQGYFIGRPMPGAQLLDWEDCWQSTALLTQEFRPQGSTAAACDNAPRAC